MHFVGIAAYYTYEKATIPDFPGTSVLLLHHRLPLKARLSEYQVGIELFIVKGTRSIYFKSSDDDGEYAISCFAHQDWLKCRERVVFSFLPFLYVAPKARIELI